MIAKVNFLSHLDNTQINRIAKNSRCSLFYLTSMKVVVDLNQCQGYGQCCYEAPDAFKLNGAEILVYDHAPNKRLRGAIERAAQACPVRAISVEMDEQQEAEND